MHRRSFALLAPTALLVACARTVSRPPPALAPGPLKLREQFLAELDGMELVRLYGLDPNGPSPSQAPPEATYIANYLVVRDAAPAPADRHVGRLHRGLRNIMEATSAVATACFEPGQGARFRGARGTFDVLVCFTCDNYRVCGPSPGDELNDSFEAADTGPWRAAFKAAGLGPGSTQKAP